MPRKVLLLEPNYKNKYPPMGLMKLATYFRARGDEVRFFKGDLRDLAVELLFEEFWVAAYDLSLGEYTERMRRYIKTGKAVLLEDVPDFDALPELFKARKRYTRGDFPVFDIVGVTTLFTFYWKETVETIQQAEKFVKDGGRLLIGGIASSILPERMMQDIGLPAYTPLPSAESPTDLVGQAQTPRARFEVSPHIGLLNKAGDIDADSDDIIDELPLDYSILDEIAYTYPANNAYFGYMTRGCIRRCSFCAVPRLEPEYRPYIGIRGQIEQTALHFGAQKDLLLLDNNVFASRCFDRIIDEIKACGFGKGELYKPSSEYAVALSNIQRGYNVRTYVRKMVKLYEDIASKLSETEKGQFYNAREKCGLLYADTATAQAVLAFDSTAAPMYDRYIYSKVRASRGRVRYIDFNQGVDARLMTDAKMKKLAEVNIRPLRIAFDSWAQIPRGSRQPMYEIYTEAVKLAAKHGIRDLSNYLLYNTDDDTPDELYRRMQLNVALCEELNVNIYSFPMKYHPIDDPEYFNNRNFIGKAWNRKYIRAVQAVLNSTHGKIGRGKSFFEAAFGKDLEQFHEILLMPEAFIIERYKYDKEAYESYLANGGTRTLDPADVACYGNMTSEWRAQLAALTPSQRQQAEQIIFHNVFTDEAISGLDPALDRLMHFYRIRRYEEIAEELPED